MKRNMAPFFAGVLSQKMEWGDQCFFDICRRKGYKLKSVTTFGGSDNHLLAAHGIRGVVLPAAMHACHSCAETTSVDELAAVAEVTAELVQSRDPLQKGAICHDKTDSDPNL